MLRLVHPPPKGQGTRPPAVPKGRRSPALRLTDAEAMRLRAALRNLKGLHGSWPKLAREMGIKPEALLAIIGGWRHPSPGIALLTARAARTSVEHILAAGPVDADRCPCCGRSG